MNFWKPIALTTMVAFAGIVGVDRHGVGVESAFADGPCHDQPNMQAAREQLMQARASLGRAEHNKRGWRVAAIASTEDALRETNRACE